jgi:hypothetical protein
MNRPELYQKTTDILVAAFFNDTLQHGNQCGCAVGNLVAANMNIPLKINGEGNVRPVWMQDGNDDPVYNTNPLNNGIWFTEICSYEPDPESIGVAQINSTGYSISEVREIERAFESCEYSGDENEWMFNGLMSVIDALDLIHCNTDTTASESTKKRFVKA